MLTLVIIFLLVFIGCVISVIADGDSIRDAFTAYLSAILLRCLVGVLLTLFVMCCISLTKIGGKTAIDTVALQQVSNTEGISEYLTVSARGKCAAATYVYVTADGESVEVYIDKTDIVSSTTGEAYAEIETYRREGIVKWLFLFQPWYEHTTFYLP